MNQVLDFIKANVIALLCGVVAILAMIALFVWPVPGYFEELNAEVKAREETHKTLTELSGASRTLPTLDPTITEPVPLNAFPNRALIAEGTKAVEQVKANASRVLNVAVEMNKRPLLVPGALPNPQSLARNSFFGAYRRATAQYGENADTGIIRRVLKGTLPPTAEELIQVEAARANQIRKESLQTDARGVAQNQPEVDARINEMKAKLPMEERVRRAQSYLVYVSPGAVEIHPAMASVADLNAITIFNAQFSLWLQTAVMEAINDANSGSKNVLDAPIKHLVSLRVPMNIADPAASGVTIAMPEGGGPPPTVELKPDASAAITPNFTRNPLGYTSNAMYDPINVLVVLRVDATRLTETLAALSRGRLLKIRNVNFRTVDAGGAMAEGYFYSRDGATPLVEVELNCDVLMLREWLVPLMPEPVKAVFSAFANPVAPV